jgi:hypothetical protein
VAVEEWWEEYFGAGAYWGWRGDGEGEHEAPEVIGRLAWRCADAETAAKVGRDMGVLGLSGPPTISGTGRTRDGKPTQLLAVEPFLIDKALVDAQVRVDVEEV